MSDRREERYIIRNGKFGAYFYDDFKKTDMTLEQVKNALNALDTLEFKFKRLVKEGIIT